MMMLLLVAACSVDTPDVALLREESEATATLTTSSTATPARAAPLRIVTPTPVVASATAPADAGGSATPAAENPETYVVQEGDTLYAIAIRFGVGLDQIIALNSLSDPNDIYVGQELKIPQQ